MAPSATRTGFWLFLSPFSRSDDGTRFLAEGGATALCRVFLPKGSRPTLTPRVREQNSRRGACQSKLRSERLLILSPRLELSTDGREPCRRPGAGPRGRCQER